MSFIFILLIYNIWSLNILQVIYILNHYFQLGRASLKPPDLCSKWGDFNFTGTAACKVSRYVICGVLVCILIYFASFVLHAVAVAGCVTAVVPDPQANSLALSPCEEKVCRRSKDCS